jgi:L-cystine transport system permease protein
VSTIDWHLVRTSLWPLGRELLRGTLPLTAVSFALGLALAVLVALMRLSGNRLVSAPARFYVSVIRGTPLLLQLFIIFFALPTFGITLSPWPSAIIGLSLNVGAYASESVRGAILAVPRGQWEAAMTVGMSRVTTLRRVVLPQAARIAVPSLSNTLISLVKDTSLVAVVLVTELFRQAQIIAGQTFQYFPLYLLAGIYYWVVCLVLSFAQTRLETRLSRHVAA